MDVRDPAWQFMGFFVAVISLVIAISIPINIVLSLILFLVAIPIFAILLLKFRKVKQIAYHVLSDTTVLSVIEGPEIHGRVQILLDNKPVRDVRIVVLKIWNSGTETIKLEDYYKDNPIKISFGDEAEALEAELLETNPKSIKKEVSSTLRLEGGCIVISPIIMERNDSFTFKALITKFRNISDISLSETRVIEASIQNWNQTLQSRIEKQVVEAPPGLFLGLFYYFSAIFLIAIQNTLLAFLNVIVINDNNGVFRYGIPVNDISIIGIENPGYWLLVIPLLTLILAFIIPRIFRKKIKNMKFVIGSPILNSIFNPVKKSNEKKKV